MGCVLFGFLLVVGRDVLGSDSLFESSLGLDSSDQPKVLDGLGKRPDEDSDVEEDEESDIEWGTNIRNYRAGEERDKLTAKERARKHVKHQDIQENLMLEEVYKKDLKTKVGASDLMPEEFQSLVRSKKTKEKKGEDVDAEENTDDQDSEDIEYSEGEAGSRRSSKARKGELDMDELRTYIKALDSSTHQNERSAIRLGIIVKLLGDYATGSQQKKVNELISVFQMQQNENNKSDITAHFNKIKPSKKSSGQFIEGENEDENEDIYNEEGDKEKEKELEDKSKTIEKPKNLMEFYKLLEEKSKETMRNKQKTKQKWQNLRKEKQAARAIPKKHVTELDRSMIPAGARRVADKAVATGATALKRYRSKLHNPRVKNKRRLEKRTQVLRAAGLKEYSGQKTFGYDGETGAIRSDIVRSTKLK